MPKKRNEKIFQYKSDTGNWS